MYQNYRNIENVTSTREQADLSMEHDASMNGTRWEKATLVTGRR